MTATRMDIWFWFDAAVEMGATHLIVACDTFDFDNYPVYVMPGEDVRKEAQRLSAQDMTKIDEVYSMSLSKESQMAEHRAFHYD